MKLHTTLHISYKDNAILKGSFNLNQLMPCWPGMKSKDINHGMDISVICILGTLQKEEVHNIEWYCNDIYSSEIS